MRYDAKTVLSEQFLLCKPWRRSIGSAIHSGRRTMPSLGTSSQTSGQSFRAEGLARFSQRGTNVEGLGSNETSMER